MKYITTGIDIGTEEIKVCVIEHDTKERISRVTGFFKYAVDGIRKGYIYNEDMFTKSLVKMVQDLEKQVAYKIENAVVSSGSASIQAVITGQNGVISKTDGEVTHFDIANLEKQLDENAIQKTRKIIFEQIAEYKIDGKIIEGNPEGLRGVKIEIKKLFVDMLAQHYESIETLFFENDIEVVSLLPKGISASKRILSEKQKMVGVCYMDIGSQTTTITVYEANVIIGYLVIPIGSNDITNDIALVLKISLEEAEQVKRGTSTKVYPKKKIDEIIFSRIEDICELTQTYLKKIKKNELLPGGVILNGGGVEIDGIEEYLKKYLKLPVKKTTFEVLTQKKGVVKQTDFIECYALALEHQAQELSQSRKERVPLFEKLKQNSSSFFKQFLP